MGDLIKCLLQVGFDIIDMFDPDADTNEIFRNTRRELFLVCKLLMGRYRRCDDQLPINLA